MTECDLLFVDDDTEMLEAYARWFGRRGFRVVAAQHPRQAISVVSRQSFDIAVIDSSLPEIDGLELLGILRRRSDMPVVMVTARRDPAHQNDAIERGVYRYLKKPFSMRKLAEIVLDARADRFECKDSQSDASTVAPLR